MKKQNSALVYGLIGAAIIIILGLVMQMYINSSMEKALAKGDAISPFKFLGVGIISFLIIAGIYIFCIIKTIKDHKNSTPEYTYGSLVRQGLLVTLIIAAVSTGFSLLYSEVIDPGARKKSIELTEKVLDNMNIPDDQKDKALQRVKDQSPVRQAVTGLGITLICGLIVSLITASVVNKRGKNFPDNPNNLS